MNANDIQIGYTVFVAILGGIACLIIAPYAVKELWRNRKRLRGWFALALMCLLCGISGRMSVAAIFYYTSQPGRIEVLATLHPWILYFNTLIAAGAIGCIRLTTITHHGERMWVTAIIASAVLAIVVAF